jgi:CheY-like chemotaxis protein
VTGEDARPKVLLVGDCSATLAVTFEGGDAPSFQHTPTSEHALAILQDVPVGADDGYQPAGRGRIGIDPLVRAEPCMAALPVIVTAVDAKPATHERALQLGANAFFIKPYSPFALGRKIEELIRET